jgi:hypothetical protein
MKIPWYGNGDEPLFLFAFGRLRREEEKPV